MSTAETTSELNGRERVSLADLPDVANVQELASFLGVSEWSVREQVTRDELPHQRIGGRIVFLKPTVLRHLGMSEGDLRGSGNGAATEAFRPCRLVLKAAAGEVVIREGFGRHAGAFVELATAAGERGASVSYPVQDVARVEWVPAEPQKEQPSRRRT